MLPVQSWVQPSRRGAWRRSQWRSTTQEVLSSLQQCRCTHKEFHQRLCNSCNHYFWFPFYTYILWIPVNTNPESYKICYKNIIQPVYFISTNYFINMPVPQNTIYRCQNILLKLWYPALDDMVHSMNQKFHHLTASSTNSKSSAILVPFGFEDYIYKKCNKQWRKGNSVAG